MSNALWIYVHEKISLGASSEQNTQAIRLLLLPCSHFHHSPTSDLSRSPSQPANNVFSTHILYRSRTRVLQMLGSDAHAVSSIAYPIALIRNFASVQLTPCYFQKRREMENLQTNKHPKSSQPSCSGHFRQKSQSH